MARKVRCNKCGHEWLTNAQNPRCPKRDCKSKDVTQIDEIKPAQDMDVQGNSTELLEIVTRIEGEKAIPIDTESFEKLIYLSEILKMKPEDILAKLIDNLFTVAAPVLVPQSRVIRSSVTDYYEIDMPWFEGKRFRKLSMKFGRMADALRVARAFTNEGTSAVVVEENGRWRVYYEVPESVDLLVPNLSDFAGRKLSLRLGGY